MSFEITITICFILLSMGIIFLTLIIKHAFSLVHAAFFVLFVQGVHLVRLFNVTNNSYESATYILSHFVTFFYLVIFYLCLLMFKKWLAPNIQILNSTLHIPDIFLISAFTGWLAFKLYLFITYGANAFSATKFLGSSNLLSSKAWWENPMEFYLTTFAIGASVSYVIKLFAIRRYAYNLPVTLFFVLFNTIYVITHSTDLGPRRYIVLLFLIYISLLVWRDWKIILNFRYWSKFVVPALIIGGMLFYYQSIRTNFYLPEIATKLRSQSITQFSEGLFQVLIPVPEPRRIIFEVPFFREGPFDLIYEIIEKRVNGHPGTDGKILQNSFLLIIPKLIAGPSKTTISTDRIISSEMGILPVGSSSASNNDLPTSLLAVFIADFGWPGFFFPPIIIALGLVFFSVTPKSSYISASIKTLFFLSALLSFAGNVEGDLVSVFSISRDAGILMLVLLPVHFFETTLKRYK